MNKKTVALIGLALTLSLISCKSMKEKKEKTEEVVETAVNEVKEKGNFEELKGSYYITFMEQMPELEGVIATVNIDSEGKISGNNGCNSYFGKLITDKEQVVSPLGSTRKMCDGTKGEVERAFMATMKEVTSITSDGKFIFFKAGDQLVMKGKKITLEGTPWQVVSVKGKSTDVMPSFEVMEGRINGSTGCNSFFGNVTQKGFDLTIKEVGSTEMFCNEIDMSIEANFIAALNKVTRYGKQNNEFVFYNGNEELFIATTEE